MYRMLRKYRCRGARKVVSAIMSMPRNAVVPINGVRRKVEEYRMWVKDLQSSPKEEPMSRVSSIQDVSRRGWWSQSGNKPSACIVPSRSRFCNSDHVLRSNSRSCNLRPDVHFWPQVCQSSQWLAYGAARCGITSSIWNPLFISDSANCDARL